MPGARLAKLHFREQFSISSFLTLFDLLSFLEIVLVFSDKIGDSDVPDFELMTISVGDRILMPNAYEKDSRNHHQYLKASKWN